MSVLASSANRAQPESVRQAALMSGAVERRTVLGELECRELPSSVEELSARTSLAGAEVQAALDALERYGQVRVLLPLDGGPELFASTARHCGKYVRCPSCGKLSEPAPHPLEPLQTGLKRRFGQEFNLGRLIVAMPCGRCHPDDANGGGGVGYARAVDLRRADEPIFGEAAHFQLPEVNRVDFLE